MGHEFEGLLGRCRQTLQHFSNCETAKCTNFDGVNVSLSLNLCRPLSTAYIRRISKLARLIYEA